MRRILIKCSFLLVLILGCEKEDLVVYCQNRYYYYNSEKIYLNEIPNQGTVSFYDTLSVDEINQLLKQYSDIQVLSIRENSRGAIISVSTENCDETDALFSNIRLNPQVSNCSKFLISTEGYSIGIHDLLVCQLKSSSSLNQLNELLLKTNTHLFKADTLKRHYLIKADKNSQGDALDMANEFFESGYFEYAEPEFLASYGTY